MRLGPRISLALAAIIGVAFGATILAFNRNAETPPFSTFFKVTDKVRSVLVASATGSNSGPKTEYRSSIFLGLQGPVIDIPRETLPGAGGGLATIGDEVLVSTFRGKIYAVTPDGQFQRTAIALPDNGLEAYREAAKLPPYDTFNHKFGKLRYNELEYYEGPYGRALFSSYVEFHADRKCFTLTLSKLDLAANQTSISDLQTEADDWRPIYQSDPCLPMRGVKAAVQGEETGGRLTFSRDGEVAYFTVGEFGWNGWHSDGRHPLSSVALAQYSEADQGKILEISLATEETRHFSIGHRNAQGITVDLEGRIWSVEHGPRGGDELNLIRDGENYGWPNVSYGSEYNGAPLPTVTDPGQHEGYTKPAYSWLPSVGISGLMTVEDFHPNWDGDLLALSLGGNALFRIRVDGTHIVLTERIDFGRRLRDIEQQSDGTLVIWTDRHEVIFLSPVEGGIGELFVEEYLADLQAAPETVEAISASVQQCAVCHSFSRSEHRTGPSLAFSFGAKMGGAKGFDGYSEGLKNASGRWDRTNLIAYLKDPQSVIPDTTMPATGIEDDKVIAGLVDTLEALSEADLY